MATVTGVEKQKTGQAQTDVHAQATVRFDWAATGVSSFITGGMYLDGWAHNHGMVDNSFFTPWHAILYSGVLFLVLFLSFQLIRNRLRSFTWRRGLPEGYLLSLAGAALFLFAGAADLIWHTVFGIETGIEPLLSPPHLLLATSGVLMVTGPLRASWARGQIGQSGGWKELGPVILTITMVLSILTFFTEFAHPLYHVAAARVGNSFGSLQGLPLGVASILLQALLLAGFILFAVLGWKLPFGALTATIFLNNTLVSTFQDNYFLLPGVLAAGLLADLLLVWLKPSATRRWQLYVFMFAVPFLFYLLYFLTLSWTAGIVWSPTLWLGTVFMAGMLGLLMSFLSLQRDVRNSQAR